MATIKVVALLARYGFDARGDGETVIVERPKLGQKAVDLRPGELPAMSEKIGSLLFSCGVRRAHVTTSFDNRGNWSITVRGADDRQLMKAA
jgi:hypothetical protein